MCPCGRDCCRAIVTVPVVVLDSVDGVPSRFVVAHGHAAEVDDVVAEDDGYQIVELKPECLDLYLGYVGRP
jgi:hypothetical protein